MLGVQTIHTTDEENEDDDDVDLVSPSPPQKKHNQSYTKPCVTPSDASQVVARKSSPTVSNGKHSFYFLYVAILSKS